MSSYDFAVDHGFPTDRPGVHTPDIMMESFESLGFGCEFGLAQRLCGAEPLGLFRFASLPYRHLLHLLQTKLADLDDPNAVTVGLRDSDEWWGLIEKFQIRYHTGKSCKSVQEGEALRGERQRVAFLKRKFMGQLEEPDKVFVRKEFTQLPGPVKILLQELHAYAPHDLLWVRRTPRSEEAMVERLGPALIAGNISRIWGNSLPDIEGLAVWIRIIEQALESFRPDTFARLRAAGSALQHTKLISTEWIGSADCIMDPEETPPPPRTGMSVFRHGLGGNGDRFNGFVLNRKVSGFVPSRLYVASAYVWIPEGFKGVVEMRFADLQMNWHWPALITKRNRWQRIAANIRIPDGGTVQLPGIYAVGSPGSWFCSAGWRIEPGAAPGDLLAVKLSSQARPFAATTPNSGEIPSLAENACHDRAAAHGLRQAGHRQADHHRIVAGQRDVDQHDL